MLALLLIAVSAILFVPVFLEYLNTGLVPRFPTLIACGFILLAGIQSFFAGMMLEVMAAKDRKKAGVAAPACGLSLVHVSYPEETAER